MNVLFLTDTKFTQEPHRDSSTRYRCYHLAEALQSRGHLSDVCTLDSFSISNLSRYDIVSVLKPTTGRKLLTILERCQALNIRTVADFDDLIFEPSLSTDAQIRQRFTLHSLAVKHFDEVSVATEPLARQRRISTPEQPVYVIPNGLSEFWLSRNSIVQNHSESESRLRLSYLPGTRSHDDDFAEIQEAISEFLKLNPTSEFHVVGPLTTDDDLIPQNRLVRGAWIDYMDLPLLISSSWATIAPLQMTRFNQAKSHIKFIESAAFGTPIICHPTEDIAQHDVDGLECASNNEQWLASMTKLADPEYHTHCQQQLREYVRRHCMASHTIDDVIDRWSSHTHQADNENTADLSKAS